jgi:hypothetical protein
MAKCNEFKVGDLVIPVKNSNGHDYKLGEVYRVVSVDSDVDLLRAVSTDGCNRLGNHLRASDCKPGKVGVETLKERLADVQSKLEKFHSEKLELESQIKWMADTGTDTFDENEYRVWQALSTIEDGDLSKLEKVKLIAALLK